MSNIFFKIFTKQILIILLGVLLLFILTRFYNLDHRMVFGWDQEQFSIKIREMIVHHNFTLLGQRVNNDAGFFLAPYLTYLLVPFYVIFKLSPYSLYFFVIIANILFFGASYFIIKKVFSQKHALWFLIFWTVNFMAQTYDSIPWDPLLIPLGVITTLYCLHLVYKNNTSWKAWMILGITAGFFSHMHFQFILILFGIMVFILQMMRKNMVKIKNIFISLFGFLITLTPLFLFDIRNNFLNSRLFFNYFVNNSSGTPIEYSAWMTVFQTFVRPYTFIKSPTVMIFFYVVILLCLLVLVFRKNNFFHMLYISFLTVWLTFPFVFALYGKFPSEYYFIFLIPIITIVLIDLCLTFKNKKIIYVMFCFLLLINIQELLYRIKPNTESMYYKNQVVEYIQKTLTGKKFIVSYDGVSVDAGFQYLFEYNNVVLSNNPADPLVQISFPAKENTKIIGRYGIYIPPELK